MQTPHLAQPDQVAPLSRARDSFRPTAAAPVTGLRSFTPRVTGDPGTQDASLGDILQSIFFLGRVRALPARGC